MDVIGRGADFNPTNRFERLATVDDWEHLDEAEIDDAPRKVATELYDDQSQSIVTENNSPDLSFRFSLNPYRGCVHGCSYCYARPYHEFLGFSAGLDFETKIMVKRDAAALFRKFLAQPSWKCQLIVMSGVTDCYQPIERQFGVTRACLQVAAAANQPLGMITKNALVTRDLDILADMATRNLVQVNISVTSLDQTLTRKMEPRTSSPAARLRAIRELTDAGVPVHVMTAPIIPGLNDSEIPKILEAAAEAGASGASYTILRLPHGVQEIFLHWLEQQMPEAKERVESRLRAVRGGELNDSQFGTRMRGEGLIAQQIDQTFRVFRKRHQLDRSEFRFDTTQFRRPDPNGRQKSLF
ncbi:PA0069 family radical SAM protein [Blastopirellula sp. JC732]|uniref:PA0069 family radical SAM protein n=1 Tax=Blastopirellula sediminis TaxID=2894196 RepID=A0A9X1ML61_9BACT|nr:PA0069 family radical SAM protein [Blastopirellula sediminis]MCC9608901.1 PA0069 family radical SAM protein [Blastopirellula sediminis]MCC9628322.1 PA0069 family radical SAM protein [Blastopirellula sediminis]